MEDADDQVDFVFGGDGDAEQDDAGAAIEAFAIGVPSIAHIRLDVTPGGETVL